MAINKGRRVFRFVNLGQCFICTDANFVGDHRDSVSLYTQSYFTTIVYGPLIGKSAYVDADEMQGIANWEHANLLSSRCFNKQFLDYCCELLN